MGTTPEERGIGGRLADFVFVSLVVAPLGGLGAYNRDTVDAVARYPQLAANPKWLAYSSGSSSQLSSLPLSGRFIWSSQQGAATPIRSSHFSPSLDGQKPTLTMN